MRLVAPGKLRPFCVGREGMKLAEGYAVVVLERSVDALARGARVLAEVRGVGESADAHHLTQPHPEGEGALRAISGAMKMAGLDAEEIGLISAHATATPNNDAAEFAAFSRAFGEGLARVPVVAFKSHLGHTLGAAGGAELILSLMAMRDQTAPATANVTRAELEFPLSIRERAEPAEIGATLNTSLGFGGANTCMVLARPGLGRRGGGGSAREVLITGIGFLAPGLIGNEALAARLSQEELGAAKAGGLEEEEYAHLISARRMRRMSAYSKLTLAATALALQDARIADVPLFAESCSVILGTTHGSASFCNEYYRQIVEQGMGTANPVMFAEGVPNAASAQLSLMLGIKGCCQTIIGSRTAGIDALRLASLRIGSGEWDRAIVGAAEENVDVLNSAYRHAGLRAAELPSAAFGDGRGFLTSCAAVTLVLESRSSMESRQDSRVRGRIGRGAAGQGTLDTRGVSMIDRVLKDIGDPECVLVSANGTSLDRVEAAGLDEAERRRGRRVSAMYGYLAETFSVGPLAGLAGVCLTGRLPRLLAGGSGLRWAAERQEQVGAAFGVLATDYAGNVSGITAERVGTGND
jgi:3-oxoacyl-[acyl-carrier-protein] synthase II